MDLLTQLLETHDIGGGVENGRSPVRGWVSTLEPNSWYWVGWRKRSGDRGGGGGSRGIFFFFFERS
jgi:hypothetical protein